MSVDARRKQVGNRPATGDMANTDTSTDTFSRDDFLGPVESLTGLPNLAYTSRAFARFERDRVLAKTWVCIAHTSELRADGWQHPVDFGGIPLLVMRDRNATTRVFHNVCSHRGLQLVTEPGPNRGLIRCPYHSWCYAADGSLKNTPHIAGEGAHRDPAFDPAAHGLKPVRHAVFAGMIFVNLSADAPDFARFIKPVTAHWSQFDFDLYAPGGDDSWWRIELAGNWKFAQENHVDGYHLPSVHPGLHAYSPLGQHYPLQIEGSAAGQGSSCQDHASDIGEQRLPLNPNLGQDWQSGRAEFLSVFPNVMIGIQADHFWTVYLLPDAPDRCVERMHISYFGNAAASPQYAGLRRANRDRMLQIFEEDRAMVEGMQRGRQSPAFAGGALAPAMDGPAHCFNRIAAEAVLQALDRA